MTEILRELVNKTVDINCGANALFCGEIVDVRDDVVLIRDNDEKIIYVSTGKIVSITETNHPQTRPGFIG